MFRICTNTPIPDVEDMKQQVQDQLQELMEQFPNFEDLKKVLENFKSPSKGVLPTIKEVIYEGYSNIMAEVNEVIDAMKAYQDMLTIENIMKPLVSVIGGIIEDFIPIIPILNISLIDLLKMDTTKIYDSVENAIKENLKIPFTPEQLLESFKAYSREVVLTVKMVIVGYKDMLVNQIKSMIQQVLDILEIAATIPTLLKVPTVEDLQNILLSLFPEYKSIVEIIKETGKTVKELVDMVTVASGTPSLNIKEQLISFYSNAELELKERFNQIVDTVSSFNLRMLVDFVKNTLGQLGFNFPVFCIEV